MTADLRVPTLSAAERQQIERWLLEFEQNWTSTRLDDWITRLPEPGSPLRALLLLGLAEIDLRRQWQAGHHATVEDYLHRFAELGTAETVAVELVLVEYLARERAGLKPRPAHFEQRFPGKQTELERLVEPFSPDSRHGPGLEPPSSHANRAAMPRLGLDSLHDGPETETRPLPEVFGRYRILRRLGQGGMGTVYLALDTRLDRQVALKVPRFAPGTNPENLERFYREARATAIISHPNLCPLYDIGEIDSVPYITMPFIDGWPLSRFATRDKRLSQMAVAATVRKIALAVAEAHRHGIIHRDLKPSNVMLNKRGEPIVMDFGLARWLQNDNEDVRLTQNGSILGAPVYMSPEQVYGDVAAMGPACDIYSLGVILYELLTGKLPFEGANTTAVLAKTLMLEPTPPSKHRPNLDPELEAICLKAMAKQIPQRYASMQVMADALSEFIKRAQTGSSSSGPMPTMKAEQVVSASDAPARKVEPPRTDITEKPNDRPTKRPSLNVALPGASRWLVVGVIVGVLAILAVPLAMIAYWSSRPTRGHLVLQVLPEEADVEIRLGENRFALDLLGVAQPMDPGEYPLKITGKVFDDFARSVTITAGATERIEVHLRARGLAPIRRPPIETPFPPAPGRVFALASSLTSVGLSGGDDFSLNVWNVDERRIVTALPGHTMPLTGVAMTRQADLGLSCAGDLTVRVWDLRERKPLRTLTGHIDWPRCVSVEENGTVALSGDDQGRILVWKPREGLLLRALEGHAGPVRAVQLSGDGKRALSAGDDGTLRLWDVDNGKALRVMGSSGDGIVSLAWTLNGKTAATGHHSGTIRLWNLDNGRELPVLRGHTSPVRGLVFARDGTRLHSASAGPGDTTVRVWDVAKSTLVHSLGESPAGTNSLVLSPDGISLIGAGDDHILRGWDTTLKSERPVPAGPNLSQRQIRRFDVPANVERLAITPDGSTLLLAGYDGGLGVWDVARGAMKKILRGHTKELRVVAVSADGRFAATGGADKQVRVWDLQSGVARILEGHTDVIWSLAFFPDGKRLASGAADRSVIVWDLDAQKPLHKLTGHTDVVRGVVPTPDGKRLVSAGLDGSLRIWNAETGQAERDQITENAAYVALALFPDGRRAVTAGRDRQIRLWDLTTPKPTVQMAVLVASTGNKPISAMSLSLCGRWVAIGVEDFQILRYQTANLQIEQRTANAHSRIPTGLVFTPDGRALVSASPDRAVKFFALLRAEADPAPLATVLTEPAKKLTTNAKTTIETAALSADGSLVLAGGNAKDAFVWDATTGKARPALIGHTSNVQGVAFVPGARKAITGSWDRSVRLWNLDTGKVERTFDGHTDTIIRVAVSADGRYLFTGSRDRSARLWEIASGRQLLALEGHGDAVWSVALSADGRLAVTGSYDRGIRWWDLVTGRLLGGYASPGDIHAVALSPDGKRIVAGGKDRAAVLIDVATGSLIARFPGHDGTIAGVAYSPDGRHFASAGDDRTARVWNVETGREVARATLAMPCWSVSFSADGKQLVTGSNEPAVCLWDLPASVHSLPTGEGKVLLDQPGVRFDRVTLSPDGSLLAVCGLDKSLRLLDFATGQEIRQFAGLPANPRYASFSPDGKTLAATGEAGLVQTWSVSDGKAGRALGGHSRIVWFNAFTPDGKRLLTCGQDSFVLVHDLATGQVVQRIEANSRGVHCLLVMPDARRLLLAGLDGSLTLRDLATGEELSRWRSAPADGLALATLALDGPRVISGGYDGVVRLWDLASGRPLAALEGHAGQVWFVVADPTGTWLASSGSDGTIRIWDSAGTTRAVYRDHTAGVTAVRFTPDGSRLVSSAMDGTVRVWTLPVR